MSGMLEMGKVVGVTGATGFVGSALVQALIGKCRVVAFTRRNPGRDCAGVQWRRSPDPTDSDSWQKALEGVDVLVHLAAIAHVRTSMTHEIDMVNARWPADLLVNCVEAGISRYIFLSSVKALGEVSESPLEVYAKPSPTDAYGRAKRSAEAAVESAASELGVDAAIIRCPLVYGPESKANLAFLTRIVDLGLPLPLAAVNNRRSLVALDNLVAALMHAAFLDRPPSGYYHIADSRSYSIAEIVRLIAEARGRSANIFKVSPERLRRYLSFLGRHDLARRLLDSLELATEDSFRRLNWNPVIDGETAFRSAFKKQKV